MSRLSNSNSKKISTGAFRKRFFMSVFSFSFSLLIEFKFQTPRSRISRVRIVNYFVDFLIIPQVGPPLHIYANVRLDFNFRVNLLTSRCTVFSSRQRRNCVVRRSVFFFLTDEELRRPLAVLRCHVYIHRRKRTSPSWSERFQIVDHERVRTFQIYLPELHIICLKKQHVQINKLIVNIFLKKFANIRILRNRFKKYRKKIN